MRVSGLVLAAFALFVGSNTAEAVQQARLGSGPAITPRAELNAPRPSLSDPASHIAQLWGLVQTRLEGSDVQDLEQAAQEGDTDAQLALAAAHIYGYDGFGSDPETGAYWASQACTAGSMPACVSLAHLQISQPELFADGVAADAAERLDDYCDDDAYAACYLRARLLSLGLYVDQNERRALRLLRNACEGGVPESCNWVAGAYYTGVLGSPDLDEATRYYALACEQGDDVACLDATFTAVDEYGEPTAVNGVTRDDFERRVARRNYAPRFVENLMTPWVYWPGADLSENDLARIVATLSKLYGGGAAWRSQYEQTPSMHMLYSASHAQGALLSSGWPEIGEQAANLHCANLDIAACFGEVMTVLTGSEASRNAEPDWALMNAYCAQDVLIACRLGELSEDWAYLVNASDEELVALLAPRCLRELEPNIQACQYAGDAALRLAEGDPFFYRQALQLHEQRCREARICNAAEENPLSGLSLMAAYRSNDLDHIRMVLEVGGAIQGDSTTARPYAESGRYDLAAQAVIDGRFEVLQLIQEYIDLNTYMMPNGEPLIYASLPSRRRYNDRAIVDRLRVGYDGRGSTYVLTWEEGESRRESLLDMGVSPDTEFGRTIYDEFESVAESYEIAERHAGEASQMRAERAERARRQRQAEARERREMRDAILTGMTQALSDANERLAAENRARDEANRREMREINNRAQNIAAYHQRRTEAARDNRNSDASFGTDAASQARIAELTRERQRIAEAAEERRRNEEARAERERRQQERNAAIRREREERRESEYRAGQRAEVERARLAARDAELVRQQWASSDASNSTVSALDWQQNALMACERTGENLRLQSPNHEFAAAENAFNQGCQIAHWLKYSTAGSNVLHCHKRDEFQDDLYDRLSERGLTAYSNYGDQAWLAWQQNMGCTDAD